MTKIATKLVLWIETNRQRRADREIARALKRS